MKKQNRCFLPIRRPISFPYALSKKQRFYNAPVLQKKPFGKLTLLFLCGILLFLPCGCKQSGLPSVFPDQQGFKATITGKTGNMELQARVDFSPFDPQSETYTVTVIYLAPASLQNVTLSAHFDKTGAIKGEISATVGAPEKDGSLSLSVRPHVLQGLLTPATRLFVSSKYTSISRSEEGFRLEYADGSVVESDPLGRPVRIIGNDLRFEVHFDDEKKTD